MHSSRTRRAIVTLAVLTLAATTPVWASGGCVNSPENPTVVLALVATAGASAAALRRKFASRRQR